MSATSRDDFASALRDLHLAAGGPTLSSLVRRSTEGRGPSTAPLSSSSISDWMNAKSIPTRSADLSALVTILASMAGRSARLEISRFESLRRSAEAEQKEKRASKGVESASPTVLGKPVEEYTDPHALEVHRPIQVIGAPTGLPEYIPRSHDVALREALHASQSSLIVLVGGSSTGKTRAAYEAVREMTGWLLHHPIFPNRATALVEALECESLSPNTIIWLNELQEYLMRDGGEVASSALRRALSAGTRVRFVATIWPRYWQELTDLNNPYPSGRELLINQSTRIDIDAAFPSALLSVAAESDARISAALDASPTRITQYLAAGPALLEFFKDCRDQNPGTWAVLCAAMDGYIPRASNFLTADFLAAAAPGYLSDEEWGQTNEDWFEQALRHASTELRGATRPLSQVRPRSATGEQIHYRLADYLVQHSQQERAETPFPRSFWDAVLSSMTDPVTAAEFARVASYRGMHKEAAELWMPLAVDGDAEALTGLLEDPTFPVEEAEALVTSAIDTIPLGETNELGWLLMDLYHHTAHKQRLVDRISQAADELRVGRPFDMSVIIEELEISGHHEAIEAYSKTIEENIESVDMEESSEVTSLIEALIQSESHAANGIGEDLAKRYFRSHKRDVTKLIYFLALIRPHIREDALTSEVRAEIHARIHEVNLTETISLHPAIANLFNARENALANELLSRTSERIDDLNLGQSYAPLELVHLLKIFGHPEAARSLARRIANEFDPGISGAALAALKRLLMAECDDAFSTMARRMAESGPILPLADAEKLGAFYTEMRLPDLHETYSERLRIFRREEGAGTL